MIPLLGIQISLVIKIFSLILLGLYLIFALVVVRQVQLMTDTLQVGFEASIKLISWIHLIFAAVVFLVALVIL